MSARVSDRRIFALAIPALGGALPIGAGAPAKAKKAPAPAKRAAMRKA